ncbi:FapA family protein, partial [Oscillibacter sp.]|uniref:FapA family protein n=1 Tax=Oscillibacter sp. TaxID=1945593 RepID=UPI0028AF53F3
MMSESSAGKFKRFFGGFGARDKSRDKQPPETGPDEQLPETSSDEQTPETSLDRQITPAQPDKPQAVPPEPSPPSIEEEAIPIPLDNPLREVWQKCDQPGLPALSPLPPAQGGMDIPPTAMNASAVKILRELLPLAQRWLMMERASIQVHAAQEAQARAAAQMASAKSDETSPSASSEEVPAPSPLEEEPTAPGGEVPTSSAPDAEAPAPVPAEPPDVDEMAQVVLSEDGMAAWLLLLPPSGKGKRLTVADGQALLREARVTFGVDQRALFSVFTKKPYFSLCPVARGTFPIEGKDGWTKEHFPRDFSRFTGNEEGGTVDYRAQACVQVIEKGAVICDIYPPTEGVAGTRVDGVSVPPKAVNPAPVLAGNYTALSEDGTKLLADMDGFLDFRDGKFHVKNILNITSDVDYSTGNIDFRGDVTIQGDVREQFSVKATGSISISGMVEAASVEAGGDVMISAGVSGNNQAIIRGKNVRARHLENCTVHAECVESDYILTSRIFCSDSVVAAGSRGSIIGGQVVAVNHIKANSIGSQSGRSTEITLGVQPEIREELHANRKELSALRDKAAELLKRAMYLKRRLEEQGHEDRRSTAEIQAAHDSLVQMTEREKTLLARQQELTEALSQLHRCRL